MTVRNFLDCSTAHIPPKLLKWFKDCEADECSPIVRHYGGWWLNVFGDRDRIPKGLQPVYDRALSLDCDYILFDQDAYILDGIPVYNW